MSPRCDFGVHPIVLCQGSTQSYRNELGVCREEHDHLLSHWYREGAVLRGLSLDQVESHSPHVTGCPGLMKWVGPFEVHDPVCIYRRSFWTTGGNKQDWKQENRWRSSGSLRDMVRRGPI